MWEEDTGYNEELRKELEALAEPKFRAFTCRLMPLSLIHI